MSYFVELIKAYDYMVAKQFIRSIDYGIEKENGLCKYVNSEVEYVMNRLQNDDVGIILATQTSKKAANHLIKRAAALGLKVVKKKNES